jgi:hypothetical protein
VSVDLKSPNCPDILTEEYRDRGGSRRFAEQIWSLHHAESVDLWRINLLRLSELRRATDFDRNFAKYILGDIIECDNWIISFIATACFTLSNLACESLKQFSTGFPDIGIAEGWGELFLAILSQSVEKMREIARKPPHSSIFALHFTDVVNFHDPTSKNDEHFELMVRQYCENTLVDRARKYVPIYLKCLSPDDADRISRNFNPTWKVKRRTPDEEIHEELKIAEGSPQDIVKVLNYWLWRCSDKGKLNAYRLIEKELKKGSLVGIDGTAVVVMMEVLLANRQDASDDSANRDVLEEAMFGHLVETGRLPEYDVMFFSE